MFRLASRVIALVAAMTLWGAGFATPGFSSSGPVRHGSNNRSHTVATARVAVATGIGVRSGQTRTSPLSTDSLVGRVNESGLISLSQNAIGTLNSAGGDVTIEKPTGATVRSAYMAAATTGSTAATLADGDVTIDGTGVSWDVSTPSAIDSNNYWSDVTSLVKPKLDGAAPGGVTFHITEANTLSTDGEILAVIFDDPNQSLNTTITLLFGAQNTSGDSFSFPLASPIDKSDPSLSLNMGLGISYGYQCCGQYNIVDVNGQRLTSSAGGQDDGSGNDGALITVGGVGDTNANPPDPNATDATCGPPAAPRCDDELYDLRPFVNTGDTNINVATQNPSADDNLFYASLEQATSASCNGQAATIVGTSGDDTLIGTTGNDVIVGLGGDDTITGNGGNDVICGGDGNDTIALGTGSGNDYVDGGSGVDLVPYGQATGPIVASLATGVVTGQGTDTLVNVENLNGSPYDDVLIGDAGPNQIRGRNGNDLVSGGGGDDVLFGEAGNDIVEGGDGNDSLDGGSQTDRCVQGAGSGSIVNCESTSPLGLSVNDASSAEGSAGSPGTATFTVSLSAPAQAAVLVDYYTADGSATAGSDYQAKAGALRFPIGVTTMQVKVPFYGDSTCEPNETFSLNLSNPYGGVVTDSVGQGTIGDDDCSGVPSISVADAKNHEYQPNEVFKVTLSAPSTSTVTVVYQTFDGTAHAGSDYKARTGTLSIPAGVTTAKIGIPLINDKIRENTEYFTLKLSSPTHCTIADGTAIGKIVDDD